MNKTVHKIYISTMVIIVVIVTAYLAYTGYRYYHTPIEKRFYYDPHSDYDWFKSSGLYGQGLGVIGTFLILFGVSIYIARKRYNFMVKYLRLKYLLEFHIFLCVLGPILILFHTTFKFGGIVSVAFWSMTAVVLSGVVGRYIYIQIPRTIEGRELSLNEVKDMKTDLATVLSEKFNLQSSVIDMIVSITSESKVKISVWNLRKELRKNKVPRSERRTIIKMVKEEQSLARKIARLLVMQKLLKYWHVIHLPFALIMLVIVIIHVIVTVSLGYKWIF